MFGPNVCVFTPSMTQAAIQTDVNAIYAQQVNNQFGTDRYALLFEPGTYGSQSSPLDIPVGYYTEVDGLGQDPSDVVINGGVTAVGMNGSGALDIFWRSVSNLTIHVVPVAPGDCHTGNEMWAVSQAAPMRRVDVKDFTTFMPYCENPNFASGGFVADSDLEGGALNGSQQQFYVRNSNLGTGGWSNYVWNQVFSGDINAPAQDFGRLASDGTLTAYTTLAQTPVSREKPYLYIDGSGNWNMFVPSPQTNSTGPTWANGHTPGTSIPLSKFFIATPSDSVSTINNALSKGLNLLFTPGVYSYGSTINVVDPNTKIIGLGFATLIPTSGNVTMNVADVPGVNISGLIFDAGPVNSPALLQIGAAGSTANNASNPVSVDDVSFRIGGAEAGSATTSFIDDSNNSIIDDVWAWRADHGTGVGWTANTATSGLIVNANNVSAYGLAVEHYQGYEVEWNGQNGEIVFFQNENPYDVPSQSAWMSSSTQDGYPAIYVPNSVTSFTGYGLGSYSYFDQGVAIENAMAFQVPSASGIHMNDLLTVFLNGSGGIESVVDGTGAAVSASNVGPSDVVSSN
jgi:hypothetical protein